MIYNVLFLLGELIAPVTVLALSAFIWRNPPRQGEIIGYRTRRSQSSEQAWYFAQVTYGKISTIVFAVFTAVTLIAGVTGILKSFDEETGFVVFTAQNVAFLVLIFAVILIVEHKLKTWFDYDGNPRV